MVEGGQGTLRSAVVRLEASRIWSVRGLWLRCRPLWCEGGVASEGSYG